MKPMTNEEMAKLLESPTEIRQDELLAIARRIRLLDAARTTWTNWFDTCGDPSGDEMPLYDPMVQARAALDADERGEGTHE